MPLNIKGILLYNFFVSKIERLLKNMSAQYGIEFFCRSAEYGVKILADLIDRNRRRYLLSKQTRLSGIKHLPSFGSKKIPGIENVKQEVF